MSEERYKCIICGKAKDTLISVLSNVDGGSMFLNSRGICQECLLKGNLNKVCNEFKIKKAKEMIESAKGNLEFWKEELDKLSENKK